MMPLARPTVKAQNLGLKKALRFRYRVWGLICSFMAVSESLRRALDKINPSQVL